MENDDGVRHHGASRAKSDSIPRDGTKAVIQTRQTVNVMFGPFKMSMRVLANVVPTIFVEYQVSSGWTVEDPARPRCVENSVKNLTHSSRLLSPTESRDTEDTAETYTFQRQVRGLGRKPY